MNADVQRVNEKLPTEYLLHEFDELISCLSGT